MCKSPGAGDVRAGCVHPIQGYSHTFECKARKEGWGIDLVENACNAFAYVTKFTRK